MPDSPRHWSLLTKSRSGVVSILRDLTLDECRQAYCRLNPDYGQTYNSYDYVYGGCWSHITRQFNDGDIVLREAFGPAGWDASETSTWDEWPKYELITIDNPKHPNYKPTAS